MAFPLASTVPLFLTYISPFLQNKRLEANMSYNLITRLASPSVRKSQTCVLCASTIFRSGFSSPLKRIVPLILLFLLEQLTVIASLPLILIGVFICPTLLH